MNIPHDLQKHIFQEVALKSFEKLTSRKDFAFFLPQYSLNIIENQGIEITYSCENYEMLELLFDFLHHDNIFEQVKKLNIEHRDFIHGWNEYPIDKFIKFGNWINLEILEFPLSNQVNVYLDFEFGNNPTLATILKVCPKLKKLRILGNSSSKNLPQNNLEQLEVYLHNTAEFLQELIETKNFQNLRKLIIHDIPQEAIDSGGWGPKASSELIINFLNSAFLPKLSQLELENTSLNSNDLQTIRATKLFKQVRYCNIFEDYYKPISTKWGAYTVIRKGEL